MQVAAALTLSLGWIYLATYKVIDYSAFVSIVQAQALTDRLHLPASAAAVGWIGLEVAAGAGGLATLLLDPRRARNVLTLHAVVLLAATMYALCLWIVPSPLPVACGCGFGNRLVENWLTIAARNGALAAFVLVSSRAAITVGGTASAPPFTARTGQPQRD